MLKSLAGILLAGNPAATFNPSGLGAPMKKGNQWQRLQPGQLLMVCAPAVEKAPGEGSDPNAFDATRLELSSSYLVVTTASKPSEAMEKEAQEVSHRLNVPYVPRGDASITKLLRTAGVDFAYVVARTNEGASWIVRHEIKRSSNEKQALFPNPRMWRMVKASGFRNEPLARALCPIGEEDPVHVIDATAGLGGTALRIAHTFDLCKVTAVEVSAPLACLLDYGMRAMATHDKPWSAAAGKVSVVHADASTYLAELGAAALDGHGTDMLRPRPCVVYLNPCMDIRRKSEEDMFLHQLARLTPISSDFLQNAIAAATRRVVVRLPTGSDPQTLFGIEPTDCIEGGQSNFWVFSAGSPV